MKRKYSSWHYMKRIGHEVWDHPANAEHRWSALARSARWQIRKRLTSKPIDIDFEGLTLRCHSDSNSASNIFYFTSRYDFHEMAFLERYLRPGDGFLDVGANIGTYSLFAAAHCGLDARIEAFEPLPLAATRIRENFELNHLTAATVHQVAVDQEAGEVTFLDADVSSSIDHGDESGRFERIVVQVARIDELVSGSGFGAAKLDVEGLEQRALEGARRLIDQCDPPIWQIELADHQLRKHGSSAEGVVAWMGEAGFSPAWFDAETNQLDFSPGIWREYPNCLFVADSRRDEVLDRIGQARG